MICKHILLIDAVKWSKGITTKFSLSQQSLMFPRIDMYP